VQEGTGVGLALEGVQERRRALRRRRRDVRGELHEAGEAAVEVAVEADLAVRRRQHLAHEPLGESEQLGVAATGPLHPVAQLPAVLVLGGAVAPHGRPRAAPQRHVPRQAGQAQRLGDPRVRVDREIDLPPPPGLGERHHLHAPAEQLEGAVPGGAGGRDDLLRHPVPGADVVGSGERVTAGGERDGQCPRVADPAGHGDGGVREIAAPRLPRGERQRHRQPRGHRAA
jgi:hypothetical protein